LIADVGEDRRINIRRDHLKSAHTRFFAYVESEELDLNHVTLRKEKVEDVCDEFYQVQMAIALAVNSIENTAYRSEIEDLCFKAISVANNIMLLVIVK